MADLSSCRFCKSDMRGVEVFDTGSGESSLGQSVAWNLYACDDCGAIARENVWSNPGVLWVAADNQTVLDSV